MGIGGMGDCEVCVIGAGLAGSEAAWRLAEGGRRVLLCEMRPRTTTPAHTTGHAAEMVCSNSFKSDAPDSAPGILKAEMRRLGSLILASARETRVPAGLSLAVDRHAFSRLVTERLTDHPNIVWETALMAAPPAGTPTIVATGPLTAEPLAGWISESFGSPCLFFHDAIAPIVEAGSIDMDIAFPASRYGKGGPDFLNCPLNPSEYRALVDALLAGPRVPLRDFEAGFFEACLPIEELARRGRETLRYGPMKPVGLTDPRTGRRPFAAVQLRRDNAAGELYGMVGFQTRLLWGAQEEAFRIIPGLGRAVFARLGSVHRNTYLRAPGLLDGALAAKGRPGLFFAGQLCGVEGYLESAASGLAAAISMEDFLKGRIPRPFPRRTVLGSLLHYIANADPDGFSPVNAMLGLLPPPPPGAPEACPKPPETPPTPMASGRKAAKRAALRSAALDAMDSFMAGLDRA